METTNKLGTMFGQIPDFRLSSQAILWFRQHPSHWRNFRYSGEETWHGRLCAFNRRFLLSFLGLPKGIPSHDTFNCVFYTIDSNKFESCFIDYINLKQLLIKLLIATAHGWACRTLLQAKVSNEFFIDSLACRYVVQSMMLTKLSEN